MTTAEKILNDVIDTYCGGVYSKSRMTSATDYGIALEAVNQALQQSHVSGQFCRCTGRIFVTSENGIRTCNECMKRIS